MATEHAYTVHYTRFYAGLNATLRLATSLINFTLPSSRHLRGRSSRSLNILPFFARRFFAVIYVNICSLYNICTVFPVAGSNICKLAPDLVTVLVTFTVIYINKNSTVHFRHSMRFEMFEMCVVSWHNTYDTHFLIYSGVCFENCVAEQVPRSIILQMKQMNI